MIEAVFVYCCHKHILIIFDAANVLSMCLFYKILDWNDEFSCEADFLLVSICLLRVLTVFLNLKY